MVRAIQRIGLVIGTLNVLNACVWGPATPPIAGVQPRPTLAAASEQPTTVAATESLPTPVAAQPTAVPSPPPSPQASAAPSPPAPTNAPLDSSIRQTAWPSVIANDPKLSASDWFGQTRYEIREPGAQPLSGIPIFDQIVYLDLDSDGREEAVLPLASGGTAGDIGFWVYRQANPTPKLIAWRFMAGTKQWLDTQNGQLVASEAIYQPGEGNCCPSGRRFITFVLENNQLKPVAERTAGQPEAPPHVVDRFYSLINAKELSSAYGMLSDAYQSANPFEGWAAGYATTSSVAVEATATDTPGLVRVALTATDKLPDGQQRVQKFAGTWQLYWSEPHEQWVLDVAQIKPVP